MLSNRREIIAAGSSSLVIRLSLLVAGLAVLFILLKICLGIFKSPSLFNRNITVPNTVTLEGAYPNPFNPVTNIKFSVPERMHVEMNIIDIQGRLVDRIVQNIYEYGNHEVVYNADLMSSGIYFIQLVTETEIKYSKIILHK